MSSMYPQQPAYVVPAYGSQPAAYASPVPEQQPLMYPQAGVGADGQAPGLPAATDRPTVTAGAKDLWAGILFWVHVIVIAVLAFALGVPAIKADSSQPVDDPNRPKLDLNTALLMRVVGTACAVGAVSSSLLFLILRRCGGALIHVSLLSSFAILAVMAAAGFVVSPVAGILLAIPALLSLLVYTCLRKRIPFAAAHLNAACTAVGAHSSLFFVAVGMLVVQGAFSMLWSLAALGVGHSIQAMGNSTNTTLSAAPYLDSPAFRALSPLEQQEQLLALSSAESYASSTSSQLGVAATFLMLVSLFWGAQVFKNIVHFITAAVVGSWWFSTHPEKPVGNATRRAFTSSFGSIALGSLIVAILHAIETIAKSLEKRAHQKKEGGLAILACLCLCTARMLRRATEFLNVWAYIYCALTGGSFVQGGRDAFKLLADRGWTAILNDDLAARALRMADFMVAALSAVAGGGLLYATMPSHPDRAAIALIGGLLSFAIGLSMAIIMTSVLISAVRAVFVCFAMNPAALGLTHPEQLDRLVSAWHVAHPSTFASCGYAAVYVNKGQSMV